MIRVGEKAKILLQLFAKQAFDKLILLTLKFFDEIRRWKVPEG